jgi:thiol-disulfide isomerase/thioredoxin
MRRALLACVGCALLGADGVAERPLALETLEGAPAILVPAPGEALVVHFWATWCPSCTLDLAALDAAAQGCAAARVRIVTVNVGEAVPVVREHLATHRLRLPVLRDPASRAFRGLGARELPLNLVWTVDAHRLEPGPRDADQWQSRLVALGCGG